MKILWIKMGALWPLDTGGRLRSFNILAELSKRHQVTVLCTHGDQDDPSLLKNQLAQGTKVVSTPYTIPKRNTGRFLLSLLRSWFSSLPVDLEKFRVPQVSDEVQKLISAGDVDLCVVDFMSATPNVEHWNTVPTVYFSHNVEHMIWKRLSKVKNVLLRPALELEWRKMRKCEADVCQRAALALTVSDTDTEIFQSLAPTANLATIPTGVDTSYFSLGDVDDSQSHMVFTGSMDWHPNEDAILYFIDNILPKIRLQIPDATLTVVGRNPSENLRNRAASASVEVTGTVEDIRSYIARAALYIVPLRIGGGTRLKIFEALAMGKAVLSTTIGAEGLPLEPGRHIALADGPENFAREAISLLGNQAKRRSLGAAGRDLVETHYSWPKVARIFEQKCYEAVRRFTDAPSVLYSYKDNQNTKNDPELIENMRN